MTATLSNTRTCIDSANSYLTRLVNPQDDYGKIGPDPSPRTLQVVLMLDRSGSMELNGRMAKLNNAVDVALSSLRTIQAGLPNVAIMVSVISFASTVELMCDHPIDVDSFVYTHLNAGGMTNLADALEMLEDQLHKKSNASHHGIIEESRSVLPPAILIISDGYANGRAYQPVLEKLRHNGYFQCASRVGVAIDNEALVSVLQDITGDPETVINIDDDDRIIDVINECLKGSVQVSSTTGPALGSTSTQTATKAVGERIAASRHDQESDIGKTQRWNELVANAANVSFA